MDELSDKRNALQARRLSIIDFSSEDDSLIFNSFSADPSSSENQELTSVALLEGADSNLLQDSVETLEQREQLPQPSESLEPEITRRNGKYNLRKSLAWDTAFFTSAGVLEPEEISNIIEGVDKSEKRKLPGIQEEICRSVDSISTLESDCLTLESLEADLFEDVRASIQKSSKASNAASARSKKAGSGVTQTQNSHSSRELDLASQNKIKLKTAPKKPSVGLRGPGKTTKEVSARPQLSQSFATSGESTSTLAKRPKVLGNDSLNSTISNKRASLGDIHAKVEKNNGRNATGKGTPVSKIPGLASSRSIVPRPNASSKSSSLGYSTATKTQPTPSSSFDSSGSASSENIRTSPHNSIKRKIDSRTGNPPSFGSTLKTPSRIASRNKTESGSSHLLAHLTCATKLSSSTSPASSISEWSSESSSSSSTVKRRSNGSRASLDTSSCKGLSVDIDAPHVLDSQNHCNEQGSVGNQSQVTGLLGQRVKKASSGTGPLHSASMKPSGLRLPSPKIGFFDGVKSTGRTPPGSMPSHPVVPSGLPKIGAKNVSPSGGNKAKFGKLQPARIATRSIKPDPQQTSLNIKPKSPILLQESSISSMKGSSASRNIKSCPGISPKVQNRLSPKTGGESHLKAEEVGAKGLNIGIFDPDVDIAEKNRSFSVLKDKVSPETKVSAHVKDMKFTPISGGPNTTSCDSSSNFGVESVTPCQEVGEGAIDVQHNVKNDLHLINSTNDKVKFKLEDEVGGLSRQVRAMDINKEIQNKLIGDSLSQSRLNVSGEDNSSASKLSCQGERLDFSLQDEFWNGLSKPTLVLPPTTFGITASTRMPLSVKEDEDALNVQYNLKNDLHLINSSNGNENFKFEDQVDDGLSRQVGAMDTSKESQNKLIGDSLSLSQLNVSCQDYSGASELSFQGELLDCSQQGGEYLKGLSKPTLSLFPTTFESTACARIPFSVKDSFCNMDRLSDASTGLTVVEVEKTSTLPSLESNLKENS